MCDIPLNSNYRDLISYLFSFYCKKNDRSINFIWRKSDQRIFHINLSLHHNYSTIITINDLDNWSGLCIFKNPRRRAILISQHWDSECLDWVIIGSSGSLSDLEIFIQGLYAKMFWLKFEISSYIKSLTI